ncbi:unnamed protein product [Prunus brigantina]
MGSLSAGILVSGGISMNWRLRRWLDCWTYWRNSDEGEVFSPYAQILKAKTPPKVKIFVWQAVLGKLNTGDTLQRHCPYMCLSPHWCVLCNRAGESVDHLLLHCPFSIKLWEMLLKEINTA